MRGKTISICALLLTTFSSSFAYKTITCWPDNVGDLTVNFKYNRNSLRVYQQQDSPSVHLFITDSQFSIKGENDNNNTNNGEWLTTKVHGVAKINANDHSKGLEDCKFYKTDVTSTNSLYNKLEIECINSKLCKSLGAVRDDDFARTPINFSDHEPMGYLSSAVYNLIFPKTQEDFQPKKSESKENKQIRLSVESIIRMVASRFYYERNGGYVKLPDIKNTIFTASKGTVEGVQNLQRYEDVPMHVSPPSNTLQTFTFTFGVPEGHVEYEDYKAFQLLPSVANLCADVQDVLFTATIKLDFEPEHCRASLVEFGTTSPGTSKARSCGKLGVFTGSILKWFVDVWDTDIVQVVEREVKSVMADYVNEKFDCDHLRPGKSPSV